MSARAPCEPDELLLPLTNPAATPLTNVQATLTTSTPGVAITHATASYGTIAGGATGAADRPFAFTVPASVPCGTILAFTLSVGSDGYLYFTCNQLNRQPQFHEGKDLRKPPYSLFRTRIDARPIQLSK